VDGGHEMIESLLNVVDLVSVAIGHEEIEVVVGSIFIGFPLLILHVRLELMKPTIRNIVHFVVNEFHQVVEHDVEELTIRDDQLEELPLTLRLHLHT
jgi:hypothetical protein